MSALSKYRDQVRIARELNAYVVQTVDEAQAVIDEVDGFAIVTIDTRTVDFDELRRWWAEQGTGNVVLEPPGIASAPPHDGDDEHA